MTIQTFSYMNPTLEIRDTEHYGNGVFALKPIKKDEILFVMGGYILTIDDENTLTGAVANKPIEISDRFSIGPRSPSDLPLMPQHYVNHSCEPNAGFNGQIFMVAMRDITVGEEITYDYAMVMCSNPESTSYFKMNCLCGTASCRGEIAEDDWQKPKLQARYDGYFQWWLERQIAAMRAPPRKKNDFESIGLEVRKHSCHIRSSQLGSKSAPKEAVPPPRRWCWSHPALYVAETSRTGLGVYAAAEIASGELLAVLGGAVVPVAEEVDDHGVQISESLVLATPKDTPAEITDFINHSCDPSAGFRGQVFLVALRSLEAGDQITYDYAMCLHSVDGLEPYEMTCQCQSPKCRGTISENDWQLPEVQATYSGYFQTYLQQKVYRG